MNNQELSAHLDKLGIHHIIDGDTLIVSNLNEDVNLPLVFIFSEPVRFENDGDVILKHLRESRGELTLYNNGDVNLNRLIKHDHVVMDNEGVVMLDKLGVTYKNLKKGA